MRSFKTRNWGRLGLAALAAGILALTSLSPAQAWYDAYGYWHPNNRYQSYEGSYNQEAYWRHQRWCERHPEACYSRGYSSGYYGGYSGY